MGFRQPCTSKYATSAITINPFQAAPNPMHTTTPLPPAYPQRWQSLNLRWWRPWLALLLLILLFAATYGALALLLAIWRLPTPAPLGLLLAVLLAPLVALVPVTRLAVRWGLGQGGGLMDAPTRRFRWRWALCALGVSVVLFLPMLAIEMLWLNPAPLRPEPNLFGLALFLLLLVPFQAAGEEYLFRGFLSQFIGQWLRSRRWAFWLPLLLTSLLFALVHGQQDLPLFLTRFGLGAVFFWLTWHSGGLEAAIGLHAASNLLAFAQSLLTGTTLSALFSSEVDWRLALVQLLASAAIAVLLVRLQHRHRKTAA